VFVVHDILVALDGSVPDVLRREDLVPAKQQQQRWRAERAIELMAVDKQEQQQEQQQRELEHGQEQQEGRPHHSS